MVKLKVMLDMDGVVHSFVDGVRTVLSSNAPNEYTKWHAIHAPPFQWSFWKDWGFTTEQAIPIINENVFKVFSYPVLSSNAKFILALDEHFETTVVTKPWGDGEVLETCKTAKIQWLEEIGFQGEIRFSDSKAGDWDLVIEDTAANAIEAYESGSKVLFVTQPYNLQGAPVCEGLDEAKIHRVEWGTLSLQDAWDALEKEQ